MEAGADRDVWRSERPRDEARLRARDQRLAAFDPHEVDPSVGQHDTAVLDVARCEVAPPEALDERRQQGRRSVLAVHRLG
jgi:hypothetical protein